MFKPTHVLAVVLMAVLLGDFTAGALGACSESIAEIVVSR